MNSKHRGRNETSGFRSLQWGVKRKTRNVRAGKPKGITFYVSRFTYDRGPLFFQGPCYGLSAQPWLTMKSVTIGMSKYSPWYAL